MLLGTGGMIGGSFARTLNLSEVKSANACEPFVSFLPLPRAIGVPVVSGAIDTYCAVAPLAAETLIENFDPALNVSCRVEESVVEVPQLHLQEMTQEVVQKELWWQEELLDILGLCDILCKVKVVLGRTTVKEVKDQIHLKTGKYVWQFDLVSESDVLKDDHVIADKANLNLVSIEVAKEKLGQSAAGNDRDSCVVAASRASSQSINTFFHDCIQGLDVNRRMIWLTPPWSILHLAAARGWDDVCKVLLQRPDFQMVNAYDGNSRSALHHAVIQGHPAICELIAGHLDADIDQMYMGSTAYSLAKQMQKSDCANAIKAGVVSRNIAWKEE